MKNISSLLAITIFTVFLGAEAHAQHLAKLHNQTASPIQAVVADKLGNCEGWFVVPAGGTVQVPVRTARFHVFAKDNKGNFKSPSAEKIDAILPPYAIPIHNTKRFKVKKLKDGAYKVQINGQNKGTFAQHFLGQLGMGAPTINTGQGRFHQIGKEAQGNVYFKF